MISAPFIHIFTSAGSLPAGINILPLHHCRSPGKPCAKTAEYNFIAFFQISLPVALIQKNRHASGGYISTMVQAYGKLIHRNMQSLGNRLKNTQVRLVQEKVFDILGLQPCLLKSLANRSLNSFHREFVYLLPVHMHIIQISI